VIGGFGNWWVPGQVVVVESTDWLGESPWWALKASGGWHR